MKRWSNTIKALIKITGAMILIVGIALVVYLRQFGGARFNWSDFNLAKVDFDSQGIPTLTAKDWDKLIEAQGYVTASDRMWQMDLMRRSAAGRLSEWFGPLAVEWDTRRKKEDWQGTADAAVLTLPDDQKRLCDAYANGVNRFIGDHPHRVGIEYSLLKTAPESWQCRDTILILLAMAEDLSAALDKDELRIRWNKRLDSDWQAFLFPNEHPWNVPMFGKATSRYPELPVSKALPLKPLSEQERSAELQMEEGADTELGSNEWLWRGGGNYFLANDPHLSYTVPELWYDIRLRASKQDWVVGGSIPGIPGVVLGRNRFVAWGFTNLFEDVDDLIIERISPDGTKYAQPLPGGKAEWRPIEVRHLSVKVAGGTSHDVVAKFTHRGPLQQYVEGDPTFYSRQWLALKPGILQLPSLALDRSMDWKSFNAAIDQMRIPAQNIVFMDNVGNMGYRASGTGVRRRVTGMWAQPAGVGDWLGYEPMARRPRLYLPIDPHHPTAHAHIQTANQKIYSGGFDQYWSSPQREERIRSFLSGPKIYEREDMEALQHDTFSRFHKELLHWIVEHAVAKSESSRKMMEQWEAWDGFGMSQPQVFAEALLAEELFRDRTLGRVRKAFFPENERKIPYRYGLENAWMLAIIEKENGARPFGLEDKDLAEFLLDAVSAKQQGLKPGYQHFNLWTVQHPLAKIPLIGKMFRIKVYPQWGHREVVRVEQTKSGAGIRMVWDLRTPLNSTWITPVGQSGHVLTTHYSDMQSSWFDGTRLKVFPQNYDWGF